MSRLLEEYNSEIKKDLMSKLKLKNIFEVPKINKISAVKPVVIFASNIEERALLKPSEIDLRIPFPLSSSSLTLSKIKTFASTDIPIVRTMPAIPGKVSTAPRPANIPKIRRILSNNAMSAKIPEFP